MPDYGTARAGFPGGYPHPLDRPLRRILSLPDSTTLWMCNDYRAPGREAFAWRTTVAEERRANLHIHDGIGEKDFVAKRPARDRTLSVPTLLLPSIQVNIRAGQLPPPAADGRIYLKLPINRL